MTNKINKPRSQKTQCDKVKDYLKAGNTLTTYEAFIIFDITALSQRITDLRNKGYIIDSTPVEYNGRRFVSYSWSDENPPEDNQEPSVTAPVEGFFHEK